MAKLLIIFALFACLATVVLAKSVEKRDAEIVHNYIPTFPVNKYPKKYVGLEHKFPALYAPRHLGFGPHGAYGFGYKQYGGLAYPGFAYGEGFIGYPGNHHGGIYG